MGQVGTAGRARRRRQITNIEQFSTQSCVQAIASCSCESSPFLEMSRYCARAPSKRPPSGASYCQRYTTKNSAIKSSVERQDGTFHACQPAAKDMERVDSDKGTSCM